MKLTRLLVAVALLSVARAVALPQLDIYLDQRPMGSMSYKLTNGHLMLPLRAFSMIGWQPLRDDTHHVVDLAGCLRISTLDPAVQLIGGPRNVGVRRASALGTLPVKPDVTDGEVYLPARSLLSTLKYTIRLTPLSSQVTPLRAVITTPGDAASINPTVEACYRNISGTN